MKTATYIKHMEGFRGDARLYQLSEPVGYDWDWNNKVFRNHSEFVIVSATIVPFSGPETYIFPADQGGNILDWGELEGSFRGGLNHSEALEGAGYEVEYSYSDWIAEQG